MSNLWKIYVLTILSFLVGTSQFVIVGILDKIAAFAGVSIATAGQLITAFALASALGTPLLVLTMTRLKLDLRKQLLVSLVILFGGIALTLFFSGFNSLLLARIVLGIGTGVFVATSFAMAANLALPGKQGAAMSSISLGFSASLVFGVPLGRVIASVYDWQVIFWVLGFLSIAGALVIIKFFTADAGKAPMPFGQQLGLLKSPQLVAALSITFLVFMSYSIFNTYITPFLASVVTVEEQALSIVLSTIGIASLIGSKLGGRLVDHLGITPTLFGSMAVQGIALALLSLSVGWESLSILLILLWATAAWTFGLTQSVNISLLEPTIASIMLSLNSSCVQLGFAAGATLGGFAVTKSSLAIISGLGAITVFLAICAAISFKILLGKPAKKRHLENGF